MSYQLQKPYTDKQRADFIVEYNHNRSMAVFETENCLYALEANEIMVNGEPEIDVDYESKQDEKERQNRIKELKKQLE